MKALSIRQPWADLIVFCLKDIENRTRRTYYRGPLLIHAAQALGEDGEWRLCSTPAFSADMGWLLERRNHVRLYGFIIGIVDLVDCVTQHPSKWFEGPYGYVLANPVKFANSIPFPGSSGFLQCPRRGDEMNTIPGTTVPLTVYMPTSARPPLRNASEEAQRRGLLAMVHIAKKDLCLNEGEYEMILRGFKVASSGELAIPQLERLVKYLKRLGWKPVRKRRAKGRGLDAASYHREEAKREALRARCVEVAKTLENGEKRLAGLAAKICGFASLTWCRDAAKLKRLLAVLDSIKEKEVAA